MSISQVWIDLLDSGLWTGQVRLSKPCICSFALQSGKYVLSRVGSESGKLGKLVLYVTWRFCMLTFVVQYAKLFTWLDHVCVVERSPDRLDQNCSGSKLWWSPGWYCWTRSCPILCRNSDSLRWKDGEVREVEIKFLGRTKSLKVF